MWWSITHLEQTLQGFYDDYHHKMTRYIEIIAAQAEAIDPSVTAKTFPVYEAKEDESVFKYIDTASSRAENHISNEEAGVGKP